MSYVINQKAELSTDEGKAAGFVFGYASKFNGVDSYDDTIEPHAYDNFIKTGKLPKMFFNHKTFELPIGIWTKLEVDDIGLKVEGQINLNVDAGKQIYEAIKFGSIDGMSINFRMGEDDYYYDHKLIRHITNIEDLREISIVNFPADNGARMVNFKSAFDSATIETITDFEHRLRDAGLSKNDAMALISQAKKVLRTAEKSERDAEEMQALKVINNAFNEIMRG